MLNNNQAIHHPKVLCTTLYRALCGMHSTTRLKLDDNKSIDSKALLRSSCLFTLIGKSDNTISIWINDQEEFILDLNKSVKNLIPNEILILENISMKNSKKANELVHSFSMIVNSGCTEGGGSVHVFQIDILKGAIEGNSFNLVVSKWNNLCKGKNLVGLRVLNWTKMVGKKKVLDRYLIGVTLSGELMVWEEKNLEQPLQVFQLDLDDFVADLAISDNLELMEGEYSGATLIILDSKQNVKMLTIHIGERNTVQLQNKNLELDTKSFITKMRLSDSSIFIYEKLKLTHVISKDVSKTLGGTILRDLEPPLYLENILQIVEQDERSILKWNITRDEMYIHIITKSNDLLILEKDGSNFSILFKINLSSNKLEQNIIPFNRQSEFTQIVPNNLLSRFLYTNPVCILSSNHENKRNLMTITWLTPTDNSAHFVCSMNKSRHSASLVLKSKQFALNIPTLSLTDYVLKIGGCSGSDIDKFETFVNTSTNSTNKPLTLIERRNSDGLFHCFEECCAHLCCVIEKELEETCPGHHLFYCRIVEGYVKQGYWKDGKQFISIDDSYPPYLTFLGSQEFALTELNK